MVDHQKRQLSFAALNTHRRMIVKIAGVAAVSLAAANCSQPVGQKISKGGIDPKYGVAASPRVVDEGQEVPKGGGRKMVGKPYTIAGKRYTPYDKPIGYKISGTASWYGSAFHGRRTANGEVFDRHSFLAAHPTMPLPSYARVTNKRNGHSIVVRVNDRGPYHGARVLDVSERVAEALDFKRMGVASVTVEYLGGADLKGSDDRKLIASLRVDGKSAPFNGPTGRTLVASSNSFAPSSEASPETTSALRQTISSHSEPVTEETTSPPRLASLFGAAPEAPKAQIAEAPASMASLDVGALTTAPLPPERPFQVASASSNTRPSAETSVGESVDDTSATIQPTQVKIVPLPPVRPTERQRIARAN